MEREEKEPIDWRVKVSSNLDYYFESEERLQELSRLARRDEELIRSELLLRHKRSREIIWLSIHCWRCIFAEKRGKGMWCMRYDAKIVMPFHGKALWQLDDVGETDSEVGDAGIKEIDWDSPWIQVEEKRLRSAVLKVNQGYPYPCFKPKG